MCFARRSEGRPIGGVATGGFWDKEIWKDYEGLKTSQDLFRFEGILNCLNPFLDPFRNPFLNPNLFSKDLKGFEQTFAFASFASFAVGLVGQLGESGTGRAGPCLAAAACPSIPSYVAGSALKLSGDVRMKRRQGAGSASEAGHRNATEMAWVMKCHEMSDERRAGSNW